MLLAIAFLMFAVLVVGWLFVPEKGQELHAEAVKPVAPEAATSKA